MKKLIILIIGFAFTVNVQAQNNKAILKTYDSNTEVTAPSEDIIVVDSVQPLEVQVENPNKRAIEKRVAPSDRPTENERTLKNRGDSQKPIHQRGKGKPDHIREKQKGKNGDAKKEHKNQYNKNSSPKKEK